MKKITLSLALTSFLAVAHSQTVATNQIVVTNQIVITNTPDIHPAALVGNWKAEFSTKVNTGLYVPMRAANVVIGITINANGVASFQETMTVEKMRTPPTDSITGTWKKADNSLIIERPNGGFVAFRISTQTENQLTGFTPAGEIIQFNRIP